jgi:hypothetical protein
MKRSTIKGAQRFRVIANGVSFYTDAKSIYNGVGDFTTLNDAVRQAIIELDRHMADGSVGLAGTWNGYTIQLSMI